MTSPLSSSWSCGLPFDVAMKKDNDDASVSVIAWVARVRWRPEQCVGPTKSYAHGVSNYHVPVFRLTTISRQSLILFLTKTRLTTIISVCGCCGWLFLRNLMVDSRPMVHRMSTMLPRQTRWKEAAILDKTRTLLPTRLSSSSARPSKAFVSWRSGRGLRLYHPHHHRRGQGQGNVRYEYRGQSFSRCFGRMRRGLILFISAVQLVRTLNGIVRFGPCGREWIVEAACGSHPSDKISDQFLRSLGSCFSCLFQSGRFGQTLRHTSMKNEGLDQLLYFRYHMSR